MTGKLKPADRQRQMHPKSSLRDAEGLPDAAVCEYVWQNRLGIEQYLLFKNFVLKMHSRKSLHISTLYSVCHSLIVMPPARNNHHCFFLYRIDNPVFVINTPAPETTQILFQRLRLADTLKWASPYVFYQGIDPFQDSFIGLLPLAVFFPCVIIPLYPFYLHKSPIPQSVHVPPISAALPCNLPFSFPDSGYCFRCKKGLGLR